MEKNAATGAGLRPYECVVIMNPDSPIEAQKDLMRKNKKIIEDHKGRISSMETWGRRSLWNPIQKNDKGIFFHTTFYADSDAVAELERTMRINERVFRYFNMRLEDGTDLVAYLEKFKADVAAAQQNEREREVRSAERRAAGRRFDSGGRSDEEES